MDGQGKPERHSSFFDLETDPKRAELTRPASMLRTTEWGGLTLLSLLAGWAFPPYFLSVMALAFLNAGGLLWVTHLNEAGRKRLREFERDFAQGHALEEVKDYAGAAAVYRALVPRYGDVPNIAQIALHRVEYLRQNHPSAFAPAKPAVKSRAKAGERHRRPAKRKRA